MDSLKRERMYRQYKYITRGTLMLSEEFRNSPEKRKEEVENLLKQMEKQQKNLEICHTNTSGSEAITLAYDIGKLQELSKNLRSNPANLIFFNDAFEVSGAIGQALIAYVEFDPDDSFI